MANNGNDPQPLNQLEFRSIGPYRGGRVVAVAGDPAEPATFYFGDRRRRLEDDRRRRRTGSNVSDGFFKTRVGRRDRRRRRPIPNVIYVGMGESVHPRQRLARRRRLQVDRRRQDLDARRPRRHAPHRQGARPPDESRPRLRRRARPRLRAERRSAASSARSDGGKTWEQVLFASERRRRRRPRDGPAQPAHALRRDLGGAARPVRAASAAAPGSGICKSTDGGDTWTELTRNPGLPQGHARARSASPSRRRRPGRVWAMVEAEDGARVPLRRRRRDLAARQRRAATCASAPGTTRTSSPTRSDADTV